MSLGSKCGWLINKNARRHRMYPAKLASFLTTVICSFSNYCDRLQKSHNILKYGMNFMWKHNRSGWSDRRTVNEWVSDAYFFGTFGSSPHLPVWCLATGQNWYFLERTHTRSHTHRDSVSQFKLWAQSTLQISSQPLKWMVVIVIVRGWTVTHVLWTFPLSF